MVEIFSLLKISIISFKIAASPILELFMILAYNKHPLKSSFNFENIGFLTFPAKSTFLHFFSLSKFIIFPN